MTEETCHARVPTWLGLYECDGDNDAVPLVEGVADSDMVAVTEELLLADPDAVGDILSVEVTVTACEPLCEALVVTDWEDVSVCER